MRRIASFLLFILLAGVAWSASGDRNKMVAELSDGKGQCKISAEYLAGGPRRGHIWMNRSPYGGILIFRPEEWAKVRDKSHQAILKARQLTPGQSAHIAEVKSSGGGLLRIEAIKESRKPALRLTRLDGGKLSNGKPSYPDVVFMLQASDFTRFESALAEVLKEVDGYSY